jgi:4-alpha-glucanotransferase
MSSGNGRLKSPPFPPEYRASGLLLHVTSLPSPYGIGDLGPEAFAWIDRLQDAGQRYWQALPLGPTGYGDSPYQPLSSFAGNGLIISPQSLIAEGLLDPSDCHGRFDPGTVDYDSVIRFKERVLQTAWNRFQRLKRGDLRREYEEYCLAQGTWLEDYALFRALKARNGGANYIEWPTELMQRSPGSLAEARRELREEMDRIRFEQFLVSRQGEKLKAYAHAKGVTLIGDLPFFVSPDSSDVWANPELFLLGEGRRPKFVAGVPPDYFSAQGQLWGNPVYNWNALRATGYRWCIERFPRASVTCGLDSTRSLPRVCGGLAHSFGDVHGADRVMGAGSGCRLLPQSPSRVRRIAIHRGRSRSDHFGCGNLARPVPNSGHRGSAVRLRW